MLTLLFTFLLSQGRVQAGALPPRDDASQCTQCPNLRSVVDITWSCVATMFACTWISVHPNIPAPEERWWEAIIKRFQYMLWTVFAPEIILFWAIKQWHGARRVAKEYRYYDSNWTVTHAHFLQMGGFMLYDADEPIGILSYENFDALLQARRIPFPTITKREIMDRSKTDLLAKCVALGQLIWFMIQVFARLANHMPIAELELVTIALAFLTAFLYFFWWEKPVNISTSVPIHLLMREHNPPSPNLPIDSGRSQMSTFTVYDEIARRFTGPKKIGTFYAIALTPTAEIRTILVASVVGTVFGALHCLGIWKPVFQLRNDPSDLINFDFWRPFSLAVALIPGLIALVALLRIWNERAQSKISTHVAGILTVFAFLSLPFYATARVGILASGFLSLGSLPSRAFNTIQWLSYFPHV